MRSSNPGEESMPRYAPASARRRRGLSMGAASESARTEAASVRRCTTATRKSRDDDPLRCAMNGSAGTASSPFGVSRTTGPTADRTRSIRTPLGIAIPDRATAMARRTEIRYCSGRVVCSAPTSVVRKSDERVAARTAIPINPRRPLLRTRVRLQLPSHHLEIEALLADSHVEVQQHRDHRKEWRRDDPRDRRADEPKEPPPRRGKDGADRRRKGDDRVDHTCKDAGQQDRPEDLPEASLCKSPGPPHRFGAAFVLHHDDGNGEQ